MNGTAGDTADEGTILLASGNSPEPSAALFALDFGADGVGIELLDGLPTFGLALIGERLYRVLSSGADAVAELLVYDRTGVVQYRRLDGVADPHGIVRDGERMAVPCSETNEIVWLDFEGRITQRWRAPGAGDAWHVNGLHVRDGVLYASAFGQYDSNAELVEHLGAPSGVVFEVATGRRVVSGLRCPHDPAFVDGGWLVCNSRASELLHVTAAGEPRRAHLGAWTRGLALSADRIFVGLSAERHAEEDRRSAEIAVLDRATWDVRARVALPCRELHSLCRVPRSFLTALRRGFRTNPHRVSMQDREDLFRLTGNIHPRADWTPMPALPEAACRVAVSALLPTRAAVGSAFEVQVAVENRGDATLFSAPPHPVSIAYRWERCEPDGALQRMPEEGRASLPAPLIPGGTLTDFVRVVAPAAAGRYVLTLSIVQEWVRWFDDVDALAAARAEVTLG